MDRGGMEDGRRLREEGGKRGKVRWWLRARKDKEVRQRCVRSPRWQ